MWGECVANLPDRDGSTQRSRQQQADERDANVVRLTLRLT